MYNYKTMIIRGSVAESGLSVVAHITRVDKKTYRIEVSIPKENHTVEYMESIAFTSSFVKKILSGMWCPN